MRDSHQAASDPPRIEAFPPGTSVVHVGPHKTGTTAVQGSMHAARERLAEHGVWLPSPARNPVDAVREGVRNKPDDPARPAWTAVVEAFGRSGERIGVLSSEFFADADERAARRVVADLGGDRARVLVTVRPLAKIMPSQWQQHVQSGMSTRYDDWLAELLLEDTDDKDAQIFWHRHRHDRFIERWAAAAGPDRTTVLVVDDTRPERLLHDFEAMLGLPQGLLRKEKNTTNRSLTAGEIEAVRQCAEVSERRGWPKEVFREYVRYGVVPRIKTNRKPAPGEAKIATPAWALERAAEIGAEMAANIAASGVRVIGDLDVLHGGEIKAEEPGDVHLDPAVTAQAILACMTVAMKQQRQAGGAEAPRPRRESLFKTVSQRAKGRLARARVRD